MPEPHAPAAPVRAFWSGTITFGLVSIPVDFYAAARARDTSMKMVDTQGHALGRRYTSASNGKPLDNDEIVRGYETDSGKAVVITEAEFESAAPETSRDIDLLRFVPLQQVPPACFVRPYFLAPTQRAGKAYSLLAQTMERTGKAGIGRLVMRGHEYLVAIIAEHGALRAETLRYVDELRTPESIGLPAPTRVTAGKVEEFTHEIDRALEKRLDLHELEDRDAEALEQLARSKLHAHKDVVTLPEAAEDEEPDEGGAQIIDLVQLLRNSLGAGVKATPGAEAEHAGVTHADTGGELASMTREQLYRLATDLGISGRSKMDKGALVKAVQAARRRKAA
ncbi:MAG: Ku protein [Burkholderiales bacterium]